MTSHMLRTTIALALALALLGPASIPPASAEDEPRTRAETETEPNPGRNEGYALINAPARRAQAVLTIQVQSPQLSAREWIVYASQLPVLPCQTGVSSTLAPDGQAGIELSPEHRPILRARIPADTPALRKGLDLRLDYQATLWSRRLVRVRAGQGRGQDTPAPTPIDPVERRAALASGGLFDFNSEAFRRWLDDQRLHRDADEGEIDFARRVFLAVKGGLTYAFRDAMDRQASHICRAGESDCGGLSIVFASALRANRIPARLLVGRWAQSSTLIEGKPFDQQHVKAEFYAQGVGWVPADLASAVLHDRSPEGLAFFGNDPGDFLVMHLDPDLICDTVHFGRKSIPWLQAPTYWVTGSGTFDQTVTRESWSVKTTPAPELVEATLKKPDPRAGRSKRGRSPAPRR